MMRLGVVDFIGFSGVCKSWRSFALSNRNSFMAASRPPLYMSIFSYASQKECVFEDFKGIKFKTIIPHSTDKTCVGLTCGYLILFGRKTHDFWLVNPITRHELYFPDAPFNATSEIKVRAILVFSPSISGWVLVMCRFTQEIWFCIASKRKWYHVSSTFPVIDLHVFKGKIYTLHTGHHTFDRGLVSELRFGPNPKLTLLKTKYVLLGTPFLEFVSWGGRLYVIQYDLINSFNLLELDFCKMNWVFIVKTREEYGFFFRNMRCIAAEKPVSWADPHLRYRRFVGHGTGFSYHADMCYFLPHDCLNVNVLDER